MSAYLTECDFSNTGMMDREKAWHLFSDLLRLGRPAQPAELAARCTLFSASPDLIEFLCWIPDSPLFLTANHFVTISRSVFSAFSEFFSNAAASFVPRNCVRVCGSTRLWSEHITTYSRKRKRSGTDLNALPNVKRRLFVCSDLDGARDLLPLGDTVRACPSRVPVNVADDMIKDLSLHSNNTAVIANASVLNYVRSSSHLLLASSMVLSPGIVKSIQCIDDQNDSRMQFDETGGMLEHIVISDSVHLPESQSQFQNTIAGINQQNTTEHCVPHFDLETRSAFSLYRPKNQRFLEQTQTNNNFAQTKLEERVINKLASTETICFEECNILDRVMGGDGASGMEIHCRKEQEVIDGGASREGPEVSVQDVCQSDGTLLESVQVPGGTEVLIRYEAPKKVVYPERTLTARHLSSHKLVNISSGRSDELHGEASLLGQQIPSSVRDENKGNISHNQEPFEKHEKYLSFKQKGKHNQNPERAKEPKAGSTSKVPNIPGPKLLPDFESFIVEEEEGSGGYGTVYRARRKNDGKIFAVKCPHTNAPSQHVNNELKMLERFGGRNFVIKYEGSFKSGNSECFVLEHVEHDRPEVLKREIKISELHWYGYCMFKALAGLHKQGIVHRDVKPGNFLFSRKLNKGYLIDFNLATDLYQKYYASSKLGKKKYIGSLDHVPRPCSKDDPSIKRANKMIQSKFLESRGAAKDSKLLIHGAKNIKKREVTLPLKTLTDISCKNNCRSQGGDASGVTSTRTPSAERLREPVPCQGRKELINLVQEALQNPNHKDINIPASRRKRVAAPPGNVDGSLVYLSPMPLISNGISVFGAGHLKNRGEGKRNREGPCVGTKGFRAPEVLFKSQHQDLKVDIWSAGVTLLYLMIGRTPFVGDPEHNIKDIAKLRGSEELWEVAKLHNRECSFPEELLDVQSLPSVKLRKWCALNTKRPDILDQVPLSLFDLVDKCLTVNPRLRISAEEALRHEFFTPCCEALRKQRLLKRPPAESQS
ncbi:uncharacterized protein [Aristolochia californica]|uniref:uncharacterized protein n=1 Tax=Aristolochia californica TaxID=171875 RepID=UPI0035D98771